LNADNIDTWNARINAGVDGFVRCSDSLYISPYNHELKCTGMTAEYERRYARHLVLPGVGFRGQELLGKARILVVGAGGLGSPALMYLAAAGVGTLGIADCDVVELSNLQRQILFTTGDIGKPKAEIAAARLTAMNPGVRTETHGERITEENARAIIGRYDLVLDCTDNFGTRYLLNDACVLLSRPDVFGTVYQFEGQIALFDASRGSCLRCFLPAPPPPGLVPGCADGGVMGAMAGVVGSLQALQAIKIIVGAGNPLIGRLITIDGLSNTQSSVDIRKNPDCPVCGTHPTIRSLKEEPGYCHSSGDGDAGRSEGSISPSELHDMIGSGENVLLLDVRTEDERAARHIGGAFIPLHQLPERWRELESGSRIVVYCKGDTRSSQAVQFLRTKGFSDVQRLLGGIDAYPLEFTGTHSHTRKQ
jgi:sulfur-carrier protein adenylyltransferase/sulfurtransferase